jgi:hypothetical protein
VASGQPAASRWRLARVEEEQLDDGEHICTRWEAHEWEWEYPDSHLNRPASPETPDSPGGSVPVSPGLIVAAMAAYLSCAELCEAAYRREVLPVRPLVKH